MSDSGSELEDAMAKGRVGFKRDMSNLRSVHKELRVAVFSLNAGGTLALTGIYAGMDPNIPDGGVPTWLLVAVSVFAFGVFIFLASQTVAGAILRSRIWRDEPGRLGRFLVGVGEWCCTYSSWAENACLVAGALAVVSGFVGVLS